MKGVYHQLALKTVDADETLRLFNGLLFEEMISKYKQLTIDFQELSKKELYCRLAARIPSLTMEAASSSEIGILKKEHFKWRTRHIYPENYRPDTNSVAQAMSMHVDESDISGSVYRSGCREVRSCYFRRSITDAYQRGSRCQ